MGSVTKGKKKRPIAFVDVASPGTIHSVDTGEVIVERNRIKLVRAYAKSVERCVAAGAPDTRFKLLANKNGQICTAIGPIVIHSQEMAFPGCGSADAIESADAALIRAGATRGNTPAGRALDFALRKNPAIAQWRVKRELMTTFAGALYGGVQMGGDRKPTPKTGRINIDIVSSYPYLAAQKLPRVRDAIVEEGYRPGAVLVYIYGEQFAPALFQRADNGNAYYSEDIAGWYPLEEVDYHVAMGRLRVDTVRKSLTVSHSEQYLARTVDHLFTHREKYQRGTPERNVIKSALNGLLGKFASPISTWRTPTDMELEHAQRSGKFTTLRLGKSALINDLSLTGIYPRHSNIIWTALTYGRARVRLWQKIDEIASAGGRVLWVHTDAIIADVPPTYRMVSGDALGDWRLISP